MNASIDLRQLRYFVAVCEELHFGRAATRLNLSQPPLSRQIRLLEEALGVRLLDRNRKGVELTAAGVRFAASARRVLSEMERAVVSIQPFKGAQQHFSLGYTTVFDFGTYPERIFQSLQARFPNYAMRVHGKHSIGLVRDVSNGNLDVALVGLHTDVKGLALQVLHEEDMIVALPAGDPLAKRKQLSFDALAGSRMFWFKRALNPGYFDHCKAYFERIDFRPNWLPEPDDHHVLLGRIADGHGCALIPASMRSIRRRGVVFRPLRYTGEALRSGVCLAYKKEGMSAVLQAFIDAATTHPPFSAE
jgi:DNA-binding transcriptional LysR family regulator